MSFFGKQQKEVDLVIVCGELPYPPINGMRIPSYHMIRLLAHRISLGVIVVTDDTDLNITDNEKHFKHLGALGFKVIKRKQTVNKLWKLFKFITSIKPSYLLGPMSFKVKDQLYDCLKKFSPKVVLFDAEYLSPYHVAVPEGIVKVLSPNDSMSLAFYNELKYKIHGSYLKRLFVYINLHRSKRFEAETYQLFDCCHFVSKIDASYMSDLIPNIKTLVISNGVDTDYFSSAKKFSTNRACDVLFVGGLHGGNLIYIQKFIKEVWQLFKAVVPEAKLTIVSQVRPASMAKYKALGIEIIGGVEDLRVIYEQHPVVLSPVLKNCGILNKVLEGMAMSRVVIGYSIGFLGIPEARNKVHYLGANYPTELLNTLVSLSRGEYNLPEISGNARKLIQDYYTWQYKMDNFYAWLSKYLSE